MQMHHCTPVFFALLPGDKTPFFRFGLETCYSLNTPRAASARPLNVNDRSHRINSPLETLSDIKAHANVARHDGRLPFGAERGAVSS
jgi:hypothetical protein